MVYVSLPSMQRTAMQSDQSAERRNTKAKEGVMLKMRERGGILWVRCISKVLDFRSKLIYFQSIYFSLSLSLSLLKLSFDSSSSIHSLSI